jgi:hypothetical protein
MAYALSRFDSNKQQQEAIKMEFTIDDVFSALEEYGGSDVYTKDVLAGLWGDKERLWSSEILRLDIPQNDATWIVLCVAPYIWDSVVMRLDAQASVNQILDLCGGDISSLSRNVFRPQKQE